MLGIGLQVNARHYVDLFEFVDSWPDAPKRFLVLLPAKLNVSSKSRLGLSILRGIRTFVTRALPN
jgi:hypothetical protein